MKPVIALIPLVDDERDSLWMLPGYMESILDAGGAPIMLPLTQDTDVLDGLLALSDGILLTGGHDVSPEVYSEQMHPGCGAVSAARDSMEKYALSWAIERDVPVLGICRGAQFINAALGGTLWQDLPTEYPSNICHKQNPPYDVPVHEVALIEGTPLEGLLGVSRLPVNSCHHQAIRRLAPCLKPMAEAPDGIVEAVYQPDLRFVWGVQWHPEFAWKTWDSARKIISAFVQAAGI